MHVSIVGSGYVGTTVAACLADFGHDVVNIEIDEDVVDAVNAGEPPIHEPGLPELLAEHAGSRLRATTDYDAVCETDLTLLCLPTPQHDDGSLDLAIMRAGSESLGDALAAKAGDHVVVVKSTVLPGTTEEVVGQIVAERSGKRVGEDLHLGMNPEFLRMGTAVEDFLYPDKVVLGTAGETASAALRDLYAPIIEREETTLVETDVREAELIKYANNAFLAAKVSLVNELGNISKAYGADAYDVLEAVGLDERISERFLRSGLGWGGSCFPKDVNALRAGAREQGYEPELLDAAVAVNDAQPRRLVALLEAHLADAADEAGSAVGADGDALEGARIAVLGLSFKPGTDDVRKSRALDVVDDLRDRGATVVAYDPVANENVRPDYPEIAFADSAEDALEDADGAVVATDWPEFDDLTFDGMARKIVVDGRRIDVEESSIERYEGLTW